MLRQIYESGDRSVALDGSMRARWHRAYGLYRNCIPPDSWGGICYRKADFVSAMLFARGRDDIRSQIEADIVLDVIRWWQKLRDVHLTADLDNSSVRRWLRSVSYKVDEAWDRYCENNRKTRQPRRKPPQQIKSVAV